MTDVLFDRRVRVVVASTVSEDFGSISASVIEVENLRVQFSITKTLKRSANCATVRITNLAERTRSRLQSKGAKVILSAGYANTLGQIFVGDVRTIDHVRENADWVTKLDAGDGERALSHARISESFKAGVALPDVVNAACKKLGIDISDVGKKLAGDSRQFVNGYSMHGRAGAELDRVLTAAGYEWSVQDGRVQILRAGEPNTERVIELSSESGLIGSPEYGTAEKKGRPPVLKFRALLSPDIKPGGRVQFASLKHKGLHRVVKARHDGDTAGGNWYTDGEAEVI